MCERDLETEQNCNILTPTLLAITAFLFSSPGLLNQGPGGPASLGAGFLYHILFPTRLIPNWLNFQHTELYNSSTPTFFLWTSQIILIQPVHGQGYILIFLERMHLLFTQVHFLFWQPGRVVGQCTTISIYILLPLLMQILCLFVYKLIHLNHSMFERVFLKILFWVGGVLVA